MGVAVEVLDLAEGQFRAMGTDVHILVLDGADDDLYWARDEVERLEARWSRFRAESELSRINAGAGTWVPASTETLELAHAARSAWITTGGAFDPLLGAHLVDLGYDRSFREMDARGAGVRSPSSERPALAPSDLGIDDGAHAVRVAAGRALDLGGIAKGWTADRVVAGLLARGAGGACANLGGDLAVGGRAPDDAGWVVDISHQAALGVLGVLAVRQGGVATSTRLRRVWRGPEGDPRHHLVDPRTGRPCTGSLAEVTVVASTAADAEVLTKVAFAAPGRFAEMIDQSDAAAVLTDGDGATVELGDLSKVRAVASRNAADGH